MKTLLALTFALAALPFANAKTTTPSTNAAASCCECCDGTCCADGICSPGCCDKPTCCAK